MTTYHYDPATGRIYQHPAPPHTHPITNILHNIIIQEAQELNYRPLITNNQSLRIKIHNDSIIFHEDKITHITIDYKITSIPYTQYTTLKELICTTTTHNQEQSTTTPNTSQNQ